MKKETSLGFVLFSGAYLLCLLDAMLFGYSTYGELPPTDTISDCLRLVASALIITKLLIDRFYPLKTLVLMVLAGGILLVTFLMSGYSHVLYLLIVLIGIRNVDSDAVIKLDYYARLLITAFIILSSFFIIENYITVRQDSTVLRSSLGFNHPNTLAAIVMSLVFEDAIINKRKCTLPHVTVIWLLALIVFLVTANRTAVALMLAFPISILFIQNKKESVSNFTTKLLALLYPICTVFSYSAVKLCRSSRLFAVLDKLSSYRFYNCQRLLEKYGIPIIGQKVNLVSVKIARQTKSSIALLDISYLRLLIQTGPFVLIIMSFMYAKAFINSYRNNAWLTILIMVFYLIFGIVESGFNNVYMNFTIIIAASEVYRNCAHSVATNGESFGDASLWTRT